MIEHIVLFRCNESCNEQARKNFIRAARGMQALIPEILYLSAGENWSERSDGYELGMVLRFQNKETLDVYQKHPVHQSFKTEMVAPNITKVLAVDYFVE